MNALDLAKTAYVGAAAPARTLRSIEYGLFAKVTQALQAACSAGRSDFPRLAAALHDNRSLWTALAADVAQPGNQLPATLKAQLFQLYQFTDQHSRKLLAGEGEPDVLVDINLAIMRGLRGTGGAA